MGVRDPYWPTTTRVELKRNRDVRSCCVTASIRIPRILRCKLHRLGDEFPRLRILAKNPRIKVRGEKESTNRGTKKRETVFTKDWKHVREWTGK